MVDTSLAIYQTFDNYINNPACTHNIHGVTCATIKLTSDSQAGPAEAKLNLSGRVRDCVRKQAATRGGPSPKEIFVKFDTLSSLLRPFLDPSSALSVALDRLDSDSIWHVHMRRIWSGSLLVRT